MSEISWDLPVGFLELSAHDWAGEGDAMTHLDITTDDVDEGGKRAQRHLEQTTVTEDHEGAGNLTLF